MIAWCPVCPASLLVESPEDHILHVGPIIRTHPWGEHEAVPKQDGSKP